VAAVLTCVAAPHVYAPRRAARRLRPAAATKGLLRADGHPVLEVNSSHGEEAATQAAIIQEVVAAAADDGEGQAQARELCAPLDHS
jgi:hypothetical protein